MIEVKGDIFQLFESGEYDAICITTNGEIKSNGAAVMGAGIALEATKRFKGIEYRLAKSLGLKGNHVVKLGTTPCGDVIAYPTKVKWREKSNIKLIIRSAKELAQIADEKGYQKVLITPMGCGNGGLSWNWVRENVEDILNDRFYIIDNK